MRRPFSPVVRGEIQEVLQDVNLTIRKGDRVGILGVNGAGKSSLARCVAGFYNPNRGSVRVYGQVRGIFDAALGMYPELTGRENGRFLMPFLYPNCPERYDELLSEAFHFSELGHFLDRPLRTYSNGMHARLSLSLVSCLPSDVLILDEVFDGADQFFQKKIAARIRDLIARSGAVIFISHSLDQVQSVCNRVLILKNGRLHEPGDVQASLRFYNETTVSFGGSP